MQEILIAPLSVSVGHKYLKHEASEWNQPQKQNCHWYFIASEAHVRDAVPFAYGDSLTVVATAGAD